jgi:hypothetical protein
MSEAGQRPTGQDPMESPSGKAALQGFEASDAQAPGVVAPKHVGVLGGAVVEQKPKGDGQKGTLAPKAEPKPLWQLAETNQGLLSLLALVAALVFGLYEYRTNRRAGDVRRREYIAMVVGVIDEMLKFTSAIRIRFDGGEPFEACVRDWLDKIIAPRFLMNAVRGNPPGDPLLAIEVNRLWVSLQMDDNVDLAGSHTSRLADMETNLKSSRAAVQARR